MIYPSDFESKIGFRPLRKFLTDYCISTLGSKWVERLRFHTDFREVKELLLQTAEMKKLLDGGADLPLDGMYDVTPYLTEIRSDGSYMSADRLFKLCGLLNQMERLRSFFGGEHSENGYDSLSRLFSPLQTFPVLISEIEKIVDRYGDVRDDASVALFEIRRSIRSLQSSMSTVMRRVIDRAVAQGIIDKDTTPAVRDGRLVIPVSAPKKREIPGIVHDESATGKTIFIEPTEVVRSANQLRELEMEEQREIITILMGIADLLRPEIDAILEGSRMVGLFDFIRAKALLAQQIHGEMPVLEKKPEIDWYSATHPVLRLSLESQGREVVPLTLRLDKNQRILVISGPNAGGKSVCLKTVGIIQYMLQCGLLPSMYSNSHAGVFRNLFIDIGDEQSIENDLSTYSSHLRNMKHFLRNANPSTLFLADEMGSGTEPQIGGALAQAILSALNEKKCFGIVTTHYQNLKTFADSEEGLINGAMLYDREHLQPLFQLAVGSPGSSFALEIATKTGLDPKIIAKAKDIVGSDYVNLDKYILDIARDRRYWANKRMSIREKERRLEEIIEKNESKADDLRTRRAEIIGEARKQAREIMEGANARLENAIHEIRRNQAEKERTKELRAELEKYKRQLQEEGKDKVPELLRPDKKKRPQSSVSEQKKSVGRALIAGDYVKMQDGGVTGKILSISGKRAEVAFGALRTFVDLGKLKAVSAPKPTATETLYSVSKETSDDSRKRQLDFKPEIDVRGMRADEALQAVTYFIDDAVQFAQGRVRILHGTGHGILRQIIREYLRSNQNVVSAADEDVRFGGAGITVVNLR